MDAAYNATRIGGGDHRLYDGGHSLVGSFQAAREASVDDSIFEEAAGLLQALPRDATTPRGLPLVTWDQDTFNQWPDRLTWQSGSTQRVAHRHGQLRRCRGNWGVRGRSGARA